MELKQLNWKTQRKIAASAAIFALCAGWSGSALSATTTAVSCDDLTRDLRSLEIPAGALSVATVDHVTIEPAPSDIELLDAESTPAETAAPFLFLTPRVASFLKDIFEVSGEVEDQDTVGETSSSPVAESERIPDLSELLAEPVPAGARENEINLPLFQQRMFRTDI